MVKWLVCGGRDFGNLDNKERGTSEWDKAYAEYMWGKGQLDILAEKYSKCYVPDDNWLPWDIVIIHGKARGADMIADQWGVVNWVANILEFPADWEKHGKAAGPIRNQQMLDEGKPDLVIAFPGGRGTTDMVRRAKKAGVEVIELKYEQTS